MTRKLFLPILITLLIGLGAGGTYYYYGKYQAAQFALDNPDLTAQNEVKNLTDKLGKLIELPSDEEPTVATVLDQDKLKDQAFFSSAKNGDKVIIYTKKKMAILYRESDNKIIEVAPLSLTDEATSTKTPKPTPEPTEAPALAPTE